MMSIFEHIRVWLLVRIWRKVYNHKYDCCKCITRDCDKCMGRDSE